MRSMHLSSFVLITFLWRVQSELEAAPCERCVCADGSLGRGGGEFKMLLIVDIVQFIIDNTPFHGTSTYCHSKFAVA